MIRILIVDDHQIVRRGLKEVLTEEFPELEVGMAEHSQAALDQIMKQPWELVLLDIDIPGRGGLEMLEEAKRLCPRTPVLILSIYPEKEFAVRALKLGASGYLNKVQSSDEIVAAIRKVLAGGKYVSSMLAEKLADMLGDDAERARHESLSSRELQVLRMVANNLNIKAIAAELALSERTVGTYRTRISKKTGLATNVELTRYALQHHLVD
jgi:two-component system invasion response regulator UvrY